MSLLGSIDTKNSQINKSIRSSLTKKGSIDVDKVRIYEIKENDNRVKQINLEPIILEKQNQKEKKDQSDEHILTKKVQKHNALNQNINFSRSEGKINEKNELNQFNRQIKILPQRQFYIKIQKFLSYFINITQKKQKSLITSEQFYNLFQFRKNLQYTKKQNFSSVKFLWEIQYTNYLSFLQYVIQTKQKRYEIFGQKEQVYRIKDLIEREIDEIQRLYLKIQEDKYRELFSEEQLAKMREFERKIHELYGQNSLKVNNSGNQSNQQQEVQGGNNIGIVEQKNQVYFRESHYCCEQDGVIVQEQIVLEAQFNQSQLKILQSDPQIHQPLAQITFSLPAENLNCQEIQNQLIPKLQKQSLVDQPPPQEEGQIDPKSFSNSFIHAPNDIPLQVVNYQIPQHQQDVPILEKQHQTHDQTKQIILQQAALKQNFLTQFEFKVQKNDDNIDIQYQLSFTSQEKIHRMQEK